MNNPITNEEAFLSTREETNTENKTSFGMRCPYCCSDLSRSFREFPVLNRRQYIQHIVQNHDVLLDLARRQYEFRFDCWKEEIV